MGGRGAGGKKKGKRGTPLYKRPQSQGGRGKPDNDGDEMMTGDKRTNMPYQKGSHGNVNTIIITKYAPGTERKDLIKFLNERCSIPFTFSEFHFTDKQTIVKIQNDTEARALQSLSGIWFNGEKLEITLTKGSKTQTGPGASKILLDYIESHFVKDAGFLSLSNLKSQPELQSIKIDFNDKQFCNIIFTVARAKCGPKVTTVDLSANDITSLVGVSALGRNLRQVINLSLSHNKISDLTQLSHLKVMKLRELSLEGNPISSTGDEQYYRNQVIKIFPTLEYLDTKEVVKPPATPLILPRIQGAYFDNPQNQTIVAEFLLKYFELYDSNRQSLVDYYADQSFFSYTVGTEQLEPEKSTNKKQKSDLYSLYGQSRQLSKLKNPERKVATLHSGRIAIVHKLTTDMPKTKHDITEFIVDGFLVHGQPSPILTVSIHGSYTDVSNNENTFKRSFDRVFVLAQLQTATGSRVVIINDMLHIRPYHKFATEYSTDNSLELLQQQQEAAAAAASSSVAPGAMQEPPQAVQEQMVQQLSSVTGMNMNFSYICLKDNNWNYQGALERFNALKDQIPPEAFVK